MIYFYNTIKSIEIRIYKYLYILLHIFCYIRFVFQQRIIPAASTIFILNVFRLLNTSQIQVSYIW